MTDALMEPVEAVAVVSPADVLHRQRQTDGGEWAFLDVRERGEMAEGHPFGSTNLPYSQLEHGLALLVPRTKTPIILIDGGDGVAIRAARAMRRVGWRHVRIVEGGCPAWLAAGLPLFKGVHTWSKAFGEWVQHSFAPPEVGPEELASAMSARNPPLLIDGRPLSEHRAFALPGSQNCPNAELPLRLPALAPEGSEVVIHCAGRTRSIIGAQTVRDFGLPVRVAALRDGTQGWELAGFARVGTSERAAAPEPTAEQKEQAAARARQVMQSHSIPTVTAGVVDAWLRSAGTTYRFDPRPEEEGAPPPGYRAAPGTTLIQQTDRFVAVSGARVVLWDPLIVRAVFAALWLRRMGIASYVQTDMPTSEDAAPVRMVPLPDLPEVPAIGLAHHCALGGIVIDIRPGKEWQTWRLRQALRALRPTLHRLALPTEARVVLLCRDAASAQLAAIDLADAGHRVVGVCRASREELAAVGLAIQTLAPPDGWNTADMLDEVMFCAGRHHGNLEDARTYLDWETGLVTRLEAFDMMPWPARLPASPATPDCP